jgi:hypothetical protein
MYIIKYMVVSQDQPILLLRTVRAKPARKKNVSQKIIVSGLYFLLLVYIQ